MGDEQVSQQRFNNMNADCKNNILSMALDSKQLELERARMQQEDQQAKHLKHLEQEEEKKGRLMEEISFIRTMLYEKRTQPAVRSIYEAALESTLGVRSTDDVSSLIISETRNSIAPYLFFLSVLVATSVFVNRPQSGLLSMGIKAFGNGKTGYLDSGL